MTRSIRILLTAFAASFAIAGAIPAQAGSVTLTDPNCDSFLLSGPAGAQTLQCVVGAPGPGAPTGCVPSIVTNPSPLTSAGGTATVSVAGCQPAGVTYLWMKSGSPLAGGNSATPPADTLAANTGAAGITWAYQVQVCNGTSCNNWPTSPLTAFVPGSGGGGGGAADLSGCTSAGYVGRLLDVPYPIAGNTSIFNGAKAASPSGSFGNNDALVVRFTTPALSADNTAIFQPAGNAPYQNTSRVYAVSALPCQFPTSSTPSGSILHAAGGQSPAITVQIGTCPYAGTGYVGYCYSKAWLQPSTTYYVTMVNRTTFGGTASCASSNCDMRIDFNK